MFGEKYEYYDCEGASILIGTANSATSFSNGYGDGSFKVSILDKEDSIEQFKSEQFHYGRWDFVGSVRGEHINVYSLDYINGDELRDKRNILYTLSGRYGVYCKDGDIVLVKWD